MRKRITTWAFAANVVLLVSLGLLLAILWATVNRYDAVLEDLTQASADANQLLFDLVDAETGMRGYVITADPNYLTPYHGGRNKARQALDRLGPRLDHWSDDLKMEVGLRQLIQERLDTMSHTLEIATEEGFEKAQDFIRDNVGKKIMDRIRAAIAGGTEIHAAEIASVRSARVNARYLLTGAIMVLTIAAIIAALSQFMLFRREIIARIDSDDRLTRKNRELKLLSGLADALLSSDDRDESHQIIESYARDMLPGSTGALYVYNNSRDHLVPAATWGTEGAAMAAPFEPHECWSLRRGKATLGRKGLSHVACAHVDTDELCYLCIPIMARGKVLGVLHLRAPGDEPAEAFAGGMREIAESLAEQLSLALVNIELKESLKNMAIRDALTGLYNRRFLDEVLARELARADRLRSPLSVIMIDIDHFKKFNDTYGHAAGDEVLKQVCAYLSDSLRQTEIVCRYGGEELVILLPDCDAGGAVEIAEKLRNGIRSLAVVHHGQDLPRVTASLGVTAYPEVTTSKADVVAAADQALYEAKRNGRDQTRLHTTQPAPAE